MRSLLVAALLTLANGYYDTGSVEPCPNTKNHEVGGNCKSPKGMCKESCWEYRGVTYCRHRCIENTFGLCKFVLICSENGIPFPLHCNICENKTEYDPHHITNLLLGKRQFGSDPNKLGQDLHEHVKKLLHIRGYDRTKPCRGKNYCCDVCKGNTASVVEHWNCDILSHRTDKKQCTTCKEYCWNKYHDVCGAQQYSNGIDNCCKK